MLARPYSMLIIDDEQDVCEVLDTVLADHFGSDLNLVVTNSAREGLDHLKNEEFQIVLTDLNMPDHSGYDVGKTAMDKDRSTQVVYITGHVQMAVAMTCFRDGAAGMLTKPINLNNMLKIVRMCMERLDSWSETFGRLPPD